MGRMIVHDVESKLEKNEEEEWVMCKLDFIWRVWKGLYPHVFECVCCGETSCPSSDFSRRLDCFSESEEDYDSSSSSEHSSTYYECFYFPQCDCF